MLELLPESIWCAPNMPDGLAGQVPALLRGSLYALALQL